MPVPLVVPCSAKARSCLANCSLTRRSAMCAMSTMTLESYGTVRGQTRFAVTSETPSVSAPMNASLR
ncbi:MAG: hypothetical protein AMJ93_06525 [Anaerolineae bacterium SM23_84]|nr:MAG: hypothetical protein AMJ93_06525 [Anaerolineae bacterium SM23_84]